MKLDLTTFAFGFSINGSNGNPSWATALGQGALYKINPSDSINEILKGLIYTSVALSCVRTKIGKGGKLFSGADDESGIVLGGVFDKVYANGHLVPDCHLVVLLTRDMSRSHMGRLRLKYSPHNEILDEHGRVLVSNADQFAKIRQTLGLTDEACWFVYAMDVVDQDQLRLSIGIANAVSSMSYASNSALHEEWNSIIAVARGVPTVGDSSAINPLQLIFYGAPGTGKSKDVNDVAAKLPPEDVVRTTFHPDSDYASFVGAYKPKMVDVPRSRIVEDEIKKVTKGDAQLLTERQISYEFVPQAFTKAYVQAWRRMAAPLPDGTVAPVMLVIEEINRGDCAKVFGDLFQLLDRNDEGFSEYEIAADDDLRRHLAEAFGEVRGAARGDAHPPEMAEKLERVFRGEILLLPANLRIWATMNTSDQSLFPMDSAFKRRWDWRYKPIQDHPDENWTIAVGDERYSWWDFIEKINRKVLLLTRSEDKQLGYFFVRAKDKTVDAETFVNKVWFFLWNDVFKNCADEPECDFLKNGEETFSFRDFFDDDGSAHASNVSQFLKALKVKPAPSPSATPS